MICIVCGAKQGFKITVEYVKGHDQIECPKCHHIWLDPKLTRQERDTWEVK